MLVEQFMHFNNGGMITSKFITDRRAQRYRTLFRVCSVHERSDEWVVDEGGADDYVEMNQWS